MPEIQEYTKLEGFRYERKYVSEIYDSYQVEQIIKLNNAGFKESFKPRFINNIYFDSQRFDFYYDNIDGRFDRTKFRIRWYGEMFGFVKNPILELKIKRGVVGTKESYDLKPFEFTQNFNFNSLYEILKNSNLPENVVMKINNLKPSLINRYNRKYFQNFSGEFRITLDKDITYGGLNTGNNFSKFMITDNNKIVIELKYDSEQNSKANAISEQLPFKLNKNSKYVSGVELFYDVFD